MFLCAEIVMSKRAIRMDADAETYRRQKYEPLLQVAQGPDVLVVNAGGHSLDEIVEVRESVLSENGLHYVFMDLLGGVLAQAALFVCSLRDARE